MSKLLVMLLVCSTLFIGCKTVTLHPVTDEDIRMQGNWVCMSQDYVKHVMQVKLEAK